MSVATPTARSAVRSTSTISRAEPRSISANAHACPTPPTPTTPTLSSMLAKMTAARASLDYGDAVRVIARSDGGRGLKRARVDDRQRARALVRHVERVTGGPHRERVGAVRPEGDSGADSVGARVDGRQRALTEAGHVGAVAVGAHRDAERGRRPEPRSDGPVAGVDDRDAGLLVGDVDGRSVGRDGHAGRERAGGDGADDVVGPGVDDGDVTG